MQIFFAVVVVLIENGHLGARDPVGDEFCVKLGFGGKQGHTRDGVGIGLWIREAIAGGENEQLRDFFGVQIFLHRGVLRGAHAAKNCNDFIRFDQSAGLFDSLGRTIAVIK